MFERYTEKARRVIFFARYEASQFGAPTIEPEHLFLGLLREDNTVTARFLAGAQASTEQIRREVEAKAPHRERISPSVELPLSGETKRVLGHAHEESEQLQHRHIGTEHLLLGLLREERSVAAEILYERGLRLGAVREEIARTSDNDPRAGEEHAVEEVQHNVRGWVAEISTYGQRLLTLTDNLRKALGNRTDWNQERASMNVEGMIDVVSEQKSGAAFVQRKRRTMIGLEKLLTERIDLLRGARVGLVCNQASVNHELRHAADLFRENRNINLTTLFGPQHGIRGDVQDNMVETPHEIDAETGVPVYSLYSETREPTEEMLKNVDALVFDMQDVGCRIYTFIYTLANCMRAAKRMGKRVIVCDRPNPLGGKVLAGTVLEKGYESFVGQFPLPTRHGMTVCELARMFNEEFEIGGEMELLTMDGWSREQWFDETNLPWVLPSPNMPTLDAACVFPGTVHVEGTTMSEGRGTTRPFEFVGAPYIETTRYVQRLEEYGLAGVHFRPCYFLPTFQKHANQTCAGVQLHVTDRERFEPVIAGIATIKAAYDLYTDRFQWKQPPYEYVYDRNPFDVIAGTDKLRQSIERGDSLESIEASWQQSLKQFESARHKYLLY